MRDGVIFIQTENKMKQVGKMRILSAMFLSAMLFIPADAGKRLTVPTEYSNIQKAIHAAGCGDTVYILPGTYRENIVMADSVIVKGSDVEKVILRGNRRDAVVHAANWAVLSSVTVTQGAIGVISENTNMIIENCIIRDNFRTGIQCVVSLPEIRNNLIMSNQWSGIYCELVSYGMRTAIENNVIAHNENSGISLSRKSGVLVQDNVFIGNKQFGVWVSPDSRKSRLVYNDFWLNRKDYNSDAVVDASNVATDPLYAYYRSDLVYTSILKSNSPLLTMGKDGFPIGIVDPEKAKSIKRDSDGDGIPDDIDQCPDQPEDMDGFEDQDGCPDLDNDQDGIYDVNDACPNLPEDFDGFQDQDGCPDYDNDQDGIPDSTDKCPNVPGPASNNGCPEKK